MSTFKFIALALTISTIAANAQKLPNIQKSSLRAPSSIKIDGKSTEWDNQFQAYNNATNVYYTLSNDDNNLYLTVKSDDQSVINKILRGGITFSVNASGKKNDKDAPSITYPVFGVDRPRLNFKAMPQITSGSDESVKRADSFMYANNRMLSEKSKNILTKGIKGVDSVISVYNEDGIKAVEAFNNKMEYTCEFAIDLKHLGLTADGQKFAYNFKLNGINIDELMKNITITRGADGDVTNVTVTKSGDGGGGGGGNMSFATTVVGGSSLSGAGAPMISIRSTGGLQSLTSPTDFWGDYTLAKK